MNPEFTNNELKPLIPPTYMSCSNMTYLKSISKTTDEFNDLINRRSLSIAALKKGKCDKKNKRGSKYVIQTAYIKI